jgi:hypothetical protein
MQETQQAVAETTQKADSEAKLKSASIVNQSLDIASRMMNMIKGEGRGKGALKPKRTARVAQKPEIDPRNYREMIKYVIDDYRAGTLKMDDSQELVEKVKALKIDDDWESLAPEVKALALVNMLKHKVPED